MGISKYYVPGFEHYRITSQKVNGVMKDVPTLIESFEGRLDPGGSSRVYLADKDTYVVATKLFCAATLTEQEGDEITYDGNTYDVISPVNPLMKNHHKEILLVRRK